MPNTLTEKAIQQPLRVGMALGALALPTLWVASQDAWRLLQGQRWLDSEEVTQVFALGFLPGTVLGAGILRSLVAWRAGEQAQARRLLISHGGLVALVAGALLARQMRHHHDLLQRVQTRPPQILSHAMPLWSGYVLEFADAVPLQVALFMLLCGLFMRGSRA